MPYSNSGYVFYNGHNKLYYNANSKDIRISQLIPDQPIYYEHHVELNNNALLTFTTKEQYNYQI